MKILFLVMGFASHVTWAEGYAKNCQEHDVRVEVIPGDRWKYRMIASGAELLEKVAHNDDIVVIDGMFDVSVLVALLRANRQYSPKVLVYLHENQLTTPFSSQDRDKRKQTHWHYGMAHWRSLMVADGFVFNSETHRTSFAEALPKLINEQAPRDVAQWHLQLYEDLLAQRCVVLPYGLDLTSLLSQNAAPPSSPSQSRVPKILWNARLEDKNPSAFLQLLNATREAGRSNLYSADNQSTTFPTIFQLIVLGIDSSKDQSWCNQIKQNFKDELLFLGWCRNRSEYSSWLQKADIVVSTAMHETFGISIVESVYGGALPLLPIRLSYPEIFPPREFDRHFYRDSKEAVDRLLALLNCVRNDPSDCGQSREKLRDCLSIYDWKRMGPKYDSFFWAIARGDNKRLSDLVADRNSEVTPVSEDTPPIVFGKPGAAKYKITPKWIHESGDTRVQLFRPKSLRQHSDYNKQVLALRRQGFEPALHGGRRAMLRMLEAISMGSKIKPLSFLTNPDLLPILADAIQGHVETQDIPLYVAESQDLLNEIRGQKLNPGDSILSMISFPIQSSLQDLLTKPPILIMEDVRNAENVGSILRTAFCLGVTSIVASDTAWASLRDSRAARCSMGTIYYHSFFRTGQLAKTIREIRSNGITVYGIELDEAAKPVSPHGSSQNWAAVLGNEDAGLTKTVNEACDHTVFVPQAHGDSLNVGHAAAISLFELGRGAPMPQHDGKAACK